jgi:hypothetical protein
VSRLVTDEMVEEALNYLATSSSHIAAARAIRLRAEFKRKRVRAKLILESNQSSAIAREAWAEAHSLYHEACEEEVRAVEADENARAERNKADTIISTFRTEEATRRAGSDFS